MPYEPIVPDGQHLGTSRNEDDAVTGHLFDNDTNRLQGHAAWRFVDEPNEEDDYDYSDDTSAPPRQLTPEEIQAAAELAVLILTGIVWVVTEGTPRFVVWWSERFVPTVKSAWNRITRPRPIDTRNNSGEASSAAQATFVASSNGVELAIAESKISMSSAEWELRFRAMLAAGAFKEEQQRILANARIDDSGIPLQSPDVAEALTAQQFFDRIKLMLEANPSLLDNETSAELSRVFRVHPKLTYDLGHRQLEQ